MVTVIGVVAIEGNLDNFLCNFGDDRHDIEVQCREHLLQVVSSAFEGLPIGLGMDRARGIPGEGRDELRVRRTHQVCGLQRLSARHQLANCRSNAPGLSHWGLPGLGVGPAGEVAPHRWPLVVFIPETDVFIPYPGFCQRNLDRKNSSEMIFPAQIRAARALLDWRQDDLARAADVGITTIRRIEAQPGPVMGYVSTVLRLQAALEKAGIKFTDEDESGGIGVRLQKKKR